MGIIKRYEFEKFLIRIKKWDIHKEIPFLITK